MRRSAIGIALLLALASYGCATPGDVTLGRYSPDTGTTQPSPGTGTSQSTTADASPHDDHTKLVPTNHEADNLPRHDGSVSALLDAGLPTAGSHSDDVDGSRH